MRAAREERLTAENTGCGGAARPARRGGPFHGCCQPGRRQAPGEAHTPVGATHLHTPRAKARAGFSPPARTPRRSLPPPAHPGRPALRARPALPAPPRLSEVLPPPNQRREQRRGLQRGTPLLGAPRAPRAGLCPPPAPSSSPGRLCKERKVRGRRSCRDTPSCRSVLAGPEGREGRAGLTCFMYMVPRPPPGRRASPPEAAGRTQGSGEAPPGPLPPRAAQSPPAKQNGVAQGGGVRAPAGPTLVFPAKPRGSQRQVCSFSFQKGGFHGVLTWIHFILPLVAKTPLRLSRNLRSEKP